MQNVSQAYRESMDSLFRDRGHISVDFGIYNKPAQRNATLDSDDLTVFSTFNVFEKASRIKNYATLETGFTKVDGSPLFLPSDGSYVDTGATSGEIGGSAVIRMDFNVSASDTKGLTIEFDENYPVDFDIVSNETTVQIRGNSSKYFVTEEVFENADLFEIHVHSMLSEGTRLRIKNVTLGYGINFSNRNIVSCEIENYVSPISEDVPQIDARIELMNIDKYFDVDNPDSAINFWETGQPVRVQIGYSLPDGNIEWVKEHELSCVNIESNESKAVLEASDFIRNIDTEYFKGTYEKSVNRSYGQLIEAILTDAGITDYEIDSSAYDVYTNIPIPRVKHKEALQILSNACRCTMSVSRDNKVIIKPRSNVVENFTFKKLDMMTYPSGIRTEVVREIVVPYYRWLESDVQEDILNDIVVTDNDKTATIYFDSPYFNYSVICNSVGVTASIVESGCYFAKILFSEAGEHEVTVSAYVYNVTEQRYTLVLGNKGKTIKWENPMIDRLSDAMALANWLGLYYHNNIEYQYQTRGNPELDANDVVIQENDYIQNMKVIVYKERFVFNGAFSGDVNTRRIGD